MTHTTFRKQTLCLLGGLLFVTFIAVGLAPHSRHIDWRLVSDVSMRRARKEGTRKRLHMIRDTASRYLPELGATGE